MDTLKAKYPQLADKIVPLFVSVDPARDSLKALKEYGKDFHPSYIFLTGSPSQVQAMAKKYRVYVSKADEAEGMSLVGCCCWLTDCSVSRVFIIATYVACFGFFRRGLPGRSLHCDLLPRRYRRFGRLFHSKHETVGRRREDCRAHDLCSQILD